jgi:toxin CcdB
MPQFDVHRNAGSDMARIIPYLLNVQHDMLRDLSTRIVIPLFRQTGFRKPIGRLNPTIRVRGTALVLGTDEITAVGIDRLGDVVANLEADRYRILGAIDLLLTGA